MAKSLKELREEARSCQDCPLWANATQTGSAKGLPFVGRRGACSSVIDKQFKVSVMRGRFVDSPLAPYVFVRKALDRP
jgi:hypothetical protein